MKSRRRRGDLVEKGGDIIYISCVWIRRGFDLS
jgi:hypothetical protein